MELPNEIINYIFSFLPILNEKQKILHNIIKNYKYYFINELKYLWNLYEVQHFFIIWYKKMFNLDTTMSIYHYNFTMIQIKNFYCFMIKYR